jgi:hypothetical protein
VPHYDGRPLMRSQRFQATVEKVLKCLNEDRKDVRKGDWTNKEVSLWTLLSTPPFLVHLLLVMTKSMLLESTQLVEAGVTPQHAYEIFFFLSTPQVVYSSQMTEILTSLWHVDRRRKWTFSSYSQTCYISCQPF